MKHLFATFFAYVPRGRLRLGFVAVLGVVGGFLQGASIGLLLPALVLMQPTVDDQLRSGRFWSGITAVFGWLHLPVTLLILLLGVLALISVGQLIIYLQHHLSAGLTADFVMRLRGHAFRRFMGADLSYHNSQRSGALVTTLTLDLQRVAAVFDAVLQIISHSAIVGIYAAALVVTSWQSSVAAFAILGVGFALIYFRIRSSRRLGREMVRTNTALTSMAVERTGAVRAVQINDATERDSASFSQIAREAALVRCRHVRDSAGIRLVMEPTLAAGGVAAVYVGFSYFDLSLAQLAAFMFVLVRIVPEAYALNRARHDFAAHVSHFRTAMNAIEDAGRHTTIRGGSRSLVPGSKQIELRHVSFAYPGGTPVLRDINVVFKPGEFAAIIGPSGGGKSTLLDLICRLVEPAEGVVLVDGIDVREYHLKSLRSEVGLVCQDVTLFNDTVTYNLRYGRPDATDDEVVEAARLANAHQFIEALPDGYRTVIGPRGLTISGGERQRLALAQALVRRPSILLLDEVTSALDSESERLIQESVLRVTEGRTVIAVAHRIATVRHADVVLVLEGGVIVEQGSPQLLLRRDGLFRQYYDLQANEIFTGEVGAQ